MKRYQVAQWINGVLDREYEVRTTSATPKYKIKDQAEKDLKAQYFQKNPEVHVKIERDVVGENRGPITGPHGKPLMKFKGEAVILPASSKDYPTRKQLRWEVEKTL